MKKTSRDAVRPLCDGRPLGRSGLRHHYGPKHADLRHADRCARPAVESLPFPTLRSQIGKAEDALDTVLTDAFGLRIAPVAPPDIYLAEISFLMAQHPFIQGLPGSHEIAQAVCADPSDGAPLAA